MKRTASLLLALAVITAVMASGCMQQTVPSSHGGQELTQSQMDDQASQAIQAEMDNSIDQMTAEQIEAELLNQG